MKTKCILKYIWNDVKTVICFGSLILVIGAGIFGVIYLCKLLLMPLMGVFVLSLPDETTLCWIVTVVFLLLFLAGYVCKACDECERYK